MDLNALGYGPFFDDAFRALGRADLEPARVARSDRGVFGVWTRVGERSARLAGRMFHVADAPSDLPVVGDWVAIDAGSTGTETVVRACLPRRSRFARQAAGRETAEQVVAANVDTVFLMAGLDQDFNPRRIERYVMLAWDSGAVPVVVLNKLDLCADVDGCVEAARVVAPGVEVVTVGARGGVGLEALAPWIETGRTVGLLGSSGVGKSTLVNRLLGDERVRTSEVRESDGRGMHTTTRRELYLLPGGGLLIDTPGMRELQLWGDLEGLDEAFSDVVQLAAACRYRDCSHGDEPDCAVAAAVRSGALATERLESWSSLRRELAALERRRDARVARATARRTGREHRRIKRAKNDRTN